MSDGRVAAEPPIVRKGDLRRPPLELLRFVRQRLGGRADSEHEQSLTRLVVVVAMYVFMLNAPQPPERVADVALWSTLIFVTGAGSGLVLFAHLLRNPSPSPMRRIASLVVDAAGITATLLVGGEAAAVFFPLLLWIVLGYGFRYGRPYLLAAAAASIAMFSVVLTVSPVWREVPFIGLAALISLVILPGYFAVLLRKLQDAIHRAEEASRAKGAFLATMSHELRTPLNAVIGMTDLLSTTRLDREQRDLVVTARAAADTLLTQVDQVLDLAKIEAGRFDVEAEPVDLWGLIAGVRQMLLPVAAAKGLRLTLHVAPGTPARLMAAAVPLRQVLVNLLGNAIKFTETGRIRLIVALTDERQHLRLAVEDSGPGLSEETQAQLFRRFSQARETRGVSGGTGLGLAIARELVELMGGSIGVRSRVGHGSTFWFELPLGELADPPRPASGLIIVLGTGAAGELLFRQLLQGGARAHLAASLDGVVKALRRHGSKSAAVILTDPTPATPRQVADALSSAFPMELIDLVAVGVDDPEGAALAALPATAAGDEVLQALRPALARPELEGRTGAAQPPPQRRLDVLVAEDNRTNQKVIGKILERAGHRPTIVADGDAVIELLAERPFDVILMDINMPGLSGVEVMRLLGFSHAAGELPPVVALSADITPATRSACEEAGFRAYLTKPIDTPLLLGTLDDLAGGSVVERVAEPILPAPPVVAVRHEASPSARPSIDPSRLASLRTLDSGDGFLTEVVEAFLTDTAAMLAELDRALMERRPQVFHDLGHALRSSAAHLGALALVDICLAWRGLEDEALMSRAADDLSRLHAELATLETALRAMVAEAAPADP